MKAPISMMSFSDSSDVHMGHIRLSGRYSISSEVGIKLMLLLEMIV